MSQGYRFLFGPVRSRRLGRSLGIDLVPLKVCTWDCPYCQVGVTTEKTLVRRDYVPVEAVLAEFDDWMARDGQADCVTLAGGGEPTLHAHFGEIIEAIGSRSRFRKILLSNGSLFTLPEVRVAAGKADVVKATFSAWDQASFEALHHPHTALRFDAFLQGLKAMRTNFAGEYWIEVFVVPGLNDSLAQMKQIAAQVADIAPDRIHLNTAVRPARDGLTQPVSAGTLQELAALFKPVAEVIAVTATGSGGGAGQQPPVALAERILGLLQRHPSRSVDVGQTLSLTTDAVDVVLADLLRKGVIRQESRGGAVYYCAT